MSRVGWGIVKWLIIPAGLIALGYFVIGPKLGSQELPMNLPEPAKKPDAPAATAKKYPEPQIDVTVDSLQQASANKRKRRRSHSRRRSTATPHEDAPPTTPVENATGTDG